jgi:MoaA/NifB/PqqE/SkfB family radical SAM enzyme
LRRANDKGIEMNPFIIGYKRIYEGFNYRLRTFGAERFADYCRPISITLALTSRCNARCVHCDIRKNRGPEQTPTAAQWKTVITDLRRWLGPVQVTFTGGEALMQRFAIDVIKHAINVGLIVEVLSNGYWNNQERIERLAAANPWRVTISLDAVGATHSLIRGRNDFFERTEKSLQTLERMRRELGMKFKIRLKTVVMRQNLAEINQVAKYAASRAGFEVFYQPIEQNYNTEEDEQWYQSSNNWPKDPLEAVEVVQELIKLKREGLPIANSYSQLEAMIPYFLDPDRLRLSTESHSAHESRNLCSALTTLEIRADGDVFSCARMQLIGNIQEQGISQIWESRPNWWRSGCCQEKQERPTANIASQKGP